MSSSPSKSSQRNRSTKGKPSSKGAFKEARFAEEYVRHNGDGTSAPIAAGHSPNSAAVIAAQNLRRLNIQQRIANR
jgi:hypothetical protein